jgi:hypothetical protein
VIAIGGVEKKGGGAGTGQGGGDLSADEARLAEPGNDHLAATVMEQFDRPDKICVQTTGELDNALGLDVQYLFGPL